MAIVRRVWAEENADRMKSFGYNAVAHDSTEAVATVEQLAGLHGFTLEKPFQHKGEEVRSVFLNGKYFGLLVNKGEGAFELWGVRGILSGTATAVFSELMACKKEGLGDISVDLDAAKKASESLPVAVNELYRNAAGQHFVVQRITPHRYGDGETGICLKPTFRGSSPFWVRHSELHTLYTLVTEPEA